MDAIRVLVSACLLGEKVRYDGGHKRDPFLVEGLGPSVAYVPVCPEVECGLPVPREPMEVVGGPAAPRLAETATGIDHTVRLMRWTGEKLRELAGLSLRGYVCKSGSPCCGLERGLFTRAFREAFPGVAVEEEGRLADPVLRDAFLARVLGRSGGGG